MRRGDTPLAIGTGFSRDDRVWLRQIATTSLSSKPGRQCSFRQATCSSTDKSGARL